MSQVQRSFCAEMRRQLASEQMTRFVRTLPGFEVDTRMPDKLDRLLKQIDRAGKPRAGQGAR